MISSQGLLQCNWNTWKAQISNTPTAKMISVVKKLGPLRTDHVWP